MKGKTGYKQVCKIAATLIACILGGSDAGKAQTGSAAQAHGRLSADTLSGRTLYFHPETTHAGHLHHPIELLQGRFTGLLISRPGSDPNGRFDVRLRGLTTLLNNNQPLYVVDGVPGLPLALVEPADIESVEIVPNGTAARWGLRGAGGVIRITTRPPAAGKPSVRFRSYLAVEQPGRSYEVLDAGQYVQYQNELNGSYERPSPQDNNWADLITRTALSTVSNLSVSGGSEALHYRAGLSWRNIEGVALNTGYDWLNGRIHLGSALFEDRLKLGLNMAGSSRRSRIGFREAFKYAIHFNPTAPRRTDNTQFGGYYQRMIFDYYNPLGIVEQNLHDGKDRMATGSITASYRFDPWIDGLSARLLLSGTREDLFRGEFYPDESFFRGYYSNGLARSESDDKTNRMADIRVSWDGSPGAALTLKADVGYSVQNLFHKYEWKEAENLPGATSYTVIENTDITDLEEDLVEEDHLLSAFYGNARLGDGDTWYLDLGLRYEGSSYLGSNNKWGAFPYLHTGYDLAEGLDLSFVNSWMIRAGYGVAGTLPLNSGWSKADYRPSGYYFYIDGRYVPAYTQARIKNPDLKWETTRMWSTGFDLVSAGGRFRSSFDLFLYKSTGLIVNADLPVPPYPAPSGYLNMGELSNRGMEIALQYDVIRWEALTYTTSLNFSTIRTSYNSLSNEVYSLDGQIRGFPGAICGCSTYFVRITEEEPVGQFYGPVFRGIDSNGEWIFQQSGNQIDPQTIGSGLPSSFLGWSHRLEYRNWNIDLLFRGVFGHDLISVTRLAYENRNLGNYNILASSPENLEDFNIWSSYYVEDGDYFRLDNLTVTYRVPLGEDDRLKEVQIFAGVDNLFTITGYSGIDPSARLTDRPRVPPSTGTLPMPDKRDVMAPGIDRSSTWLDSRTFMAGVDLRF